MGSDGIGGSTNGELSDAGCAIVANALELNSQDTFLDLESGSGRACYSICVQAVSFPRLCIGIECQDVRHNISVLYAKNIMDSDLLKNEEYPVWFIKANILTLETFNGYVYIFCFFPMIFYLFLCICVIYILLYIYNRLTIIRICAYVYIYMGLYYQFFLTDLLSFICSMLLSIG